MTGEVSSWDDREQVSQLYLNVKANSRCVIIQHTERCRFPTFAFWSWKNMAKSWLKDGQTFYCDYVESVRRTQGEEPSDKLQDTRLDTGHGSGQPADGKPCPGLTRTGCH